MTRQPSEQCAEDGTLCVRPAKKAFHTAPSPFPLLHVDTTWKLRDMCALRERMTRKLGMELLVCHNPEAMALGINSFDHGSQVQTDMRKTQGLKHALVDFARAGMPAALVCMAVALARFRWCLRCNELAALGSAGHGGPGS